MGVGGQRHAPTAYPPERSCIRGVGNWVNPGAGLDGCGKPLRHRDSIPDRPARSQLLYRLSCASK
jgi:hypothetical protein